MNYRKIKVLNVFILLISVFFLNSCLTYMGLSDSGGMTRGRSLIYTVPENYYPYSIDVLQEMEYSEKWEIKVKKGLDINVSAINFSIIDEKSIIVSIPDTGGAKIKRNHYLINGIDSAAPDYRKTVFNGSITVVDGKIYGIESTESGFQIHKMNYDLEKTESKTVNFYKLAKMEQNQLDSSSTGLYKVNDNVTSYFSYNNYLVLYSINYKTDRYYQYTKYQSENVVSNTIQMNIIDLNTFESVKVPETEIAVAGAKNQMLKGSAVFFDISLFELVANSSDFVISFANMNNEYAHGYFRNSPGTGVDISFTGASSIVKLFPELSLLEERKYTDSEKILKNAMDNSSSIMIEGTTLLPYAYKITETNDFIIFARYPGKSEYASVMVYADKSLENIRWKKNFRKITTSGDYVYGSGAVEYFELDEKNRGFKAVKILDSEVEIKILPINISQYENSAAGNILVLDSGLVLFDDSRCSIKFFSK